MAKEKVKTKRTSADKAVNGIIAIALVIVIALAVIALYDNFRPRNKVKDIAESMGISVEDFKAEYGLGEDVKPTTSIEDIYDDMTIENALKLDGMTFEDFAASNGLPETVTPNMKVSEVTALLEEMMADAAPVEGEQAPAEGEAAAE